MASFKTSDPAKINVDTSFSNPPVAPKSSFNKTALAGTIIQAGIGIARKTSKQNAVKGVEEAFEETGKVTATISEAMNLSGDGKKTFDPVRGDTLYIEGAPQEFSDRLAEVMTSAGDEFRAMSSAVSQGATPKMAAAIQLEAKLKELTAQYPEFSDELRQTARSLAGYDPTGFHLKQILNITAKKGTVSKTFAQKQEEQAQFVSSTLGIPVSTVLNDMARGLNLGQQRKISEAEMATGKLTASNYILTDTTATGPYMNQFFVAQMKALENGGVTNPEEQLLSLDQARSQHRVDLIKTIRQGGGSMDGSTTKFMDEQLGALYDPIKNSITNNDFGKVLARKNTTLLEVDKQFGRTVWPRLTRMNNALGERLTGTIIDQMSSFANTEQWMLYAKQQPLLWEAVQGANMSPQDVANRGMDVYEKVITGKPLEGNDKEWLKAVEPIIFDPKQEPELRANYLRNMGSEESRGVGWLAQPGKRQIAGEKDIKWMKNEWKKTVPALVDDIANEMVSNPDFHVTVTQDGKLKAFIKRGKQSKGRPVHNAQVEQLQYFVNASRNGWASDFGTTPKGVMQEITNKLTKKADEINISTELDKANAPSVEDELRESLSKLQEQFDKMSKAFEGKEFVSRDIRDSRQVNR